MGKVIKYTIQEIESIRRLYPTHSSREIAEKINRTESGIAKVAKRLGLKHDEKTNQRIKNIRRNNLMNIRFPSDWKERLSSSRKKIYRSETRLILMGKAQKTKLRILRIPHKTSKAMSRLKGKCNYFCEDNNDMVLYYDSETNRTENEQYYTIKYGIKFENGKC